MSEYQEVNRHSRESGNPGAKATAVALDPRFREGDDTLLIMLTSFRVGLSGRLCETENQKGVRSVCGASKEGNADAHSDAALVAL
jgi:hypothetical protein